MTELPHSKSCFVCGESNASGLNLRFFTDGKSVRTQFTPRAEHGGFIGIVHGGIIATILDEVMVWACAVRQKRFSFSAEMTIRYLKPVRTGVEIIASAELVENKRDRLYLARGELMGLDGLRLAESTAKYIPIRHMDPRELLGDFVGTVEQMQEFLPSVD